MDKKKKCIIDEYKTVYGFSLFVIINPDKSVMDKDLRLDKMNHLYMMANGQIIQPTLLEVHMINQRTKIAKS